MCNSSQFALPASGLFHSVLSEVNVEVIMQSPKAQSYLQSPGVFYEGSAERALSSTLISLVFGTNASSYVVMTYLMKEPHIKRYSIFRVERKRLSINIQTGFRFVLASMVKAYSCIHLITHMFTHTDTHTHTHTHVYIQYIEMHFQS